jgi:hypothetical protein
MKPLLAILFLLTTIASCQRTGTLNRKFLILSQEEFLEDNYDSTLTTLAILDKYKLSIQAKDKHDTGSIYYGGQEYYDDYDQYRFMAIGKLMDSTKILATEINSKDTCIYFYILENSNWRQIGKDENFFPFFSVEDLNGDNVNEIITSTGPNMNGNRWYDAYIYSNTHKDIRYAGSYYADYSVRKDKKEIHVNFEGSWYMSWSKIIYSWKGEKLLPTKELICQRDEPYNPDTKLTFEYFENHTDSANGMKLIYKKPIRKDEDWKVWENFFDSSGKEKEQNRPGEGASIRFF